MNSFFALPRQLNVTLSTFSSLPFLRSGISMSSSSLLPHPSLPSHFLSTTSPPSLSSPRSITFPFKPLPLPLRSFRLFSTSSQQPPQPPTDTRDEPPLPPPPPSTDTEKRSFAVATGELFLGIASRLIRGVQRQPSSASPRIETEDVDFLSGEKAEGEGKEENGERIATVIEDSIEPAVLWEQRVKDVEAEKRRKTVTSPGFSFSAAGLLFPYHLGVAQFLIENGYIKETTPLAGSSAGAIVGVVVASGRSMQEAVEATKILAEDCRQRGTAFRLGAVLRDVLEKVLPDDIHIRCNGRVRVAVTQIVWRPRGLLVDQFDSREDLINALFTSSFIPGYLAPRPATMFRNRLCIDGGLTLFMPPTSAPQTVRVCAFPASSLRLQGIGISPDCNPENRLTTRQLFNWALEPADDHMLDKLFEFGYSDARVWAQANPVDLVVQEDNPIAQDV